MDELEGDGVYSTRMKDKKKYSRLIRVNVQKERQQQISTFQ
jgi:hypothetical protein